MRVCFSLNAPGIVAELFFNIRYWHLADMDFRDRASVMGNNRFCKCKAYLSPQRTSHAAVHIA